jgi:TolA-binding protein
VQYGDTVTAEYKPEGATEPLTRTIRMHKGADGSAQLFTKRFADPSIAVQTQFTVAEAYFEVAKKHREIGQEELARREIGQGKKLLEEAVRDHPRSDARAQADYLLADLALEFANDTKDAEAKRRYYAGAIMRFGDVVASYPDSAYAPRSQFKKALTYEKMGAMDEACEEYVKLSYRYPDNELVAETIARLGQYFLEKGKGFQAQMTAEPDAVAREKIRLQSLEMYRTAAQVFGRLAVRFPDHRLAGKTTVLSGQCYMRAEDLTRAIAVFRKLLDGKQAESELLAEAMYWCGDCYMRKSDPVNAYRMFKKLTWDYPETLWAKYARGRLTEQALVAAERAAEEEDVRR